MNRARGGNKRGLWALLAGSGCLFVAIFGLIALGALAGIGVGLTAVFAPNVLNRAISGVFGFETIESQPVQGDPARFDPIASFAAMRAFAGQGAILTAARCAAGRCGRPWSMAPPRHDRSVSPRADQPRHHAQRQRHRQLHVRERRHDARHRRAQGAQRDRARATDVLV